MKPAEAWVPVSAPPLATVALAALADLLPDANPDNPDNPAAQLLRQAQDALAPGRWPEALAAACGQAHPLDSALHQMAQALQLHPAEALAAALSLACELDPATARVVAWLEGQPHPCLPSLGLLATALGPVCGGSDQALRRLLHGPAARCQLWVVAPTSADGLTSLPGQQPLRLARPVLAHMAGWDEAAVPPPGDTAPLSASQQALLRRALAPLAAGQAVLLRSADPADTSAAATWLAQQLGRTAVRVSTPEWPEGLAALTLAGHALPVLHMAGPGAPLPSPPAVSLKQPLLVLAGPEGAVQLPGVNLLALSLPAPTVAERSARWQALGWSEPDTLAARWRCGFTQLQHLHAVAHFEAGAEPTQTPPTAQHLQAALAQHAATAFEGLGQLIPSQHAPQLVLNPSNTLALQQLLARCRVREQLHDAAARSARPAVCALFSGPSGTGKTLAASWLAAQLHLPLVAIDLAALTSKWIGETEKNLAQVFARAEGLGVVLLFDEADALFGARTDTHSANDRFANQQTNYLLSRLERFDGIAVLTTNARQRLDGAFARRIDALIEFRLPDTPERRTLWALHLGSAVPAPWLDALAGLIDLPGGHVRAAALCARALALDAQRPITQADLLAALRSEYTKLGRLLPAELARTWG
jgi:hypothetical protein